MKISSRGSAPGRHRALDSVPKAPIQQDRKPSRRGSNALQANPYLNPYHACEFTDHHQQRAVPVSLVADDLLDLCAPPALPSIRPGARNDLTWPAIAMVGSKVIQSHEVLLSDSSSSGGEDSLSSSTSMRLTQHQASTTHLSASSDSHASPSAPTSAHRPLMPAVLADTTAPMAPASAVVGSMQRSARSRRAQRSRASAVRASAVDSTAVVTEGRHRVQAQAAVQITSHVPRWAALGALLLAVSLLLPLASHRLGGARSVWPGGVSPRRAVPRSPAAADASPPAVAPDTLRRSGGPRDGWRPDAKVRVLSIVSSGVSSPYRTTWDAVVEHTADKLGWMSDDYDMLVVREDELGQASGQKKFLDAIKAGAHMVVGVNVNSASAVGFLQQTAPSLPGVRVFLGSAPALEALSSLQGYSMFGEPNALQTFTSKLPWSNTAKAAALRTIINDLWTRHSSEDFLFIYLVLINQYVQTVPEVAATTKGLDLSSLQCMLSNCRTQIFDCVGDKTCNTALNCLNSCAFNDQVCQYRCIVSYETPLFEKFSLCILELNNCRGLDAKPPARPDPAPMPTFQGKPLTHEMAEGMLLGWMDKSVVGEGQTQPFSWLVASGKNPAYDFFPCQHQLFYRGKGKGQIWYEPVFKAITLDGRQVWRRRKYRVRRGPAPGTFHFSALDNGVTSKEFWRVLDCADDHSFCLFYYSGAASTAGLSYSGAVLATRDGSWPEQHQERLRAALQRAGIEMWELSYVDNSNCVGAPLELAGAV